MTIDGYTVLKLSSILLQQRVTDERKDHLKSALYERFGRYYMLHTALITVEQYNEVVARVSRNLMLHPELLRLEPNHTMLIALDVSW